MPRYRIFIEYVGEKFVGWQKQNEGATVQEELEKGIEQVLQHPVSVQGQGRTDSGVHALKQVAHFDSDKELKRLEFIKAMLGVLPRDIGVWHLEKVSDDFHVRYDAIARRYCYRYVLRPSPIRENAAQMYLGEPDIDAMQKCAEMISGKHDFSQFGRVDSNDPVETVCTVEESYWEREGDVLTYWIKADRFIRHMVRRLVGTMTHVGEGKLTPQEFRLLLEISDSTESRLDKHQNEYFRVHAARARGLVLYDVFYRE